MNEEQLVAFGGAIKALGDGRIEGYLVKFTDASRPDLVGDFFNAQTDFDLEPGDTSRVYYNHGLDPVLKRRKLTKGTMRVDDVGVWIEAQLTMRDDYERAIYAMAEAGKLGWSSGTLPNLVEYEPVGKSRYIKSWPLGKDASLTPTPAAGLIATAVQPLKTWAEATKDMGVTPAVKAIDLAERLDLLRNAVDRKFNSGSEPDINRERVYAYAEYTYEDYVIVRTGAARFRIPYTIDTTAGTVSLGDPSPVEMNWVAAKGMLAMSTGQPAYIQAGGGKAIAPGADRSSAAHANAAAKLALEITIMEVEV